jgi:predicted ATP-grasp superfamily ATP-dependent carboligase
MSRTDTPAQILKLSLGGLAAVRTLGRMGVPVHVLHDRVRAPEARSRYTRELLSWDFSASTPSETVAMLLETGRRIRGDGPAPVLITTDDEVESCVGEHADALHEVFTFPAQPPGLGRRLSSKRGLMELCREHGVPVPDACIPSTREEAIAHLRGATFPLMFKPMDNARFAARNGIRMYLARERDEAIAAYDRLEDPDAPNIMFQEYLSGADSTIWVFTGYFDEHSDLLFGAGGYKVRQYPIRTGTTCYGVVARHPELERRTADFAKALGYRGVMDLGYRRDPRDGEFKLLDVNPRVGQNFRQCVGVNGMDVVRAMYLDLTGQEVPREDPAAGRVWWVENYDIAGAVDWWRDGTGIGVREWARSLRRVDEPAWWARDDVRPFAHMIARTGGLAVRRRIPRKAW